MVLKGKEAEELSKRIIAESAKRRAELLAEAQRDAAARGKERFDLTKVETMCDTSADGAREEFDARRARFEYMYYVSTPEILTLAEFAKYVNEFGRW